MAKINGVDVFPLGLGTAWMNSAKQPGNPPKFLAQKGNEAANIGILTRYISKVLAQNNGRAIIDLAQIYGNGYTDVVVGQCLKQFPRNKLFLIWKVAPATLNSRVSLQTSLRKALSNLGVEYVDVLMSHETPGDDLSYLSFLEDVAYDEGFANSIGLGRVGLDQLKKACEITRISCIQNSGSLAVREYLPDELVGFCKRNRIAIFAYRPVKQVLENITMLKRLETVFMQLPVGYTYAQIAIAWSCTKGFIPIGSSTNPRHMQQNIEAVSLRLSDLQVAILEGRA